MRDFVDLTPQKPRKTGVAAGGAVLEGDFSEAVRFAGKMKNGPESAWFLHHHGTKKSTRVRVHPLFRESVNRQRVPSPGGALVSAQVLRNLDSP